MHQRVWLSVGGLFLGGCTGILGGFEVSNGPLDGSVGPSPDSSLLSDGDAATDAGGGEGGRGCLFGDVRVLEGNFCAVDAVTKKPLIPPPVPRGRCKLGTWRCSAGVATCEGMVGPQPESCNTTSPANPEHDEDCDGSPVNGCDCSPGTQQDCGNVPNQGICKPGSQTCAQDGKWGPCTGVVGPAARNCGDGRDNDCNGQADRTESACACTANGTSVQIGASVSCIASTAVGGCRQGTATCAPDPGDTSHGLLGACQAAAPKAPNCADASGTADDNCNGQSDMTELACHPCRDTNGNPSSAYQVFTQGMFGCAGSVAFANRDQLCNAACRPCSAGDWVARRAGITPQHHYWTNDALNFSGGGCPLACSVSATSGSSCGPNPMRVCMGATRACDNPTDPSGNGCTWTGCSLETSGNNDFFGGCTGNTTSGALCCCP